MKKWNFKKWLLKTFFKKEITEMEKIIIGKDTQIKNLKNRINLITITKGL